MGREMQSMDENAHRTRNLLIITPSYPNEDDSYIAETFVKYQIEEIKKHFNKIFVIAPTFQSFGFFQKDKKCKDYSYDNVQVLYPRCYYIPIFWLKWPLIDNRLKVIERTIGKHNIHFDLVHAHFTWPSGFIGVKLKGKYGTPVVITIHENGDWFDKEVEMNEPRIDLAWKEADALIRVNAKDVPILKKYNEQVYPIPNGFSSSFFPIEVSAARSILNVPEEKKVIFSLGNLIPRKGFNYLIDAMKIVCDRRDDVLCYIGGAGPEKGRLQNQINESNLNGKVILLGRIPKEQLNDWMNACDLFVLPSLNEGNPTVMFEALGCGKPFIGTKVGGVPEVISSDKYGMLVEPANSKDLAERISTALGTQWDRSGIIEYAQQYTWENVAQDIIKIYDRVLTNGQLP